MKTTAVEDDDTPDLEGMRGKFTMGGMCILMVPEPFFKELSDKAFAQGLTLPQFLAAAVAAYSDDPATNPRPIAGPDALSVQPTSSFEFHDGLSSDVVEQEGPKKRARLKGFR